MTKLDSVVKSIVSGLLKSNKSISKIEKLVLRKRAEVQVRTVSCSYWDHPNYAHTASQRNGSLSPVMSGQWKPDTGPPEGPA